MIAKKALSMASTDAKKVTTYLNELGAKDPELYKMFEKRYPDIAKEFSIKGLKNG